MPEKIIIDPCSFFQIQSQYVWQRIAFARKMNLRISETSVTEELLYRFYQSFFDLGMPIRLFESIEEYKNGSDIEVLVNTKHGYILLACQAKITYKTGNYRAFHHYVGGERQIDLLQAYAKLHGGIAQYLFYNHVPDDMTGWSAGAADPIENLGITHLEAEEIQSWMNFYESRGRKPPTPHFNTFHPMAALPFHELICHLLSNDTAYLHSFPDEILSSLTFYDEKDLRDAESWQQVTSLATIGYTAERYAEPQYYDLKNIDEDQMTAAPKEQKQKEPPIFKPKFRLVIGGTNNGGAIYHIE